MLQGKIDTVPEPGALHIALLLESPNDERHSALDSCFAYEPMIEFYDHVDTHRIFQARNLSTNHIEKRNELSYFKDLQDFNILLLAMPKDDGVVLRSFRFKQGRVIEGFIAKGKLNCQALFNWMNWVKVLSIPDNAHLFLDDKIYLGKTPRWVELAPGNHLLQAETWEEYIGKTQVDLPGKIEVMIQKKR